MERSGWFDDDDESSPQPPPEDRVWRHPSELGSHGAYGAPVRRRHGLRFAGALALGSAGTLVFAVLTSMHLFGGELDRGGALGLAEESSLFSISATSSLVRRTTVPTSASPAATTGSTAPVVVTTRPVASMPPKVGVRVGGADATVPAVIDDDGYVLTDTADLAGATAAEVVLDDGSHVAVTVESVDQASGVARLKPDRKVPVPENQTMSWLGVTCSDDTAPTAPAARATTTAPTPPTGEGHDPAGSTAPPAAPVSATTAMAPTAPAPPTAASSSVTPSSAATGSSVTITAPTASKVATTSSPAPASPAPAPSSPAPATTADERPRVVATSISASGPATSSGSTTTARPTTPSVTGVRVRHVHPDSPAATAGVLPGDLILAVDDRAVHSRWALVLAVRRHAIGEQVRVEVLRDGARRAFDVVLAAGPTA